MLNRNFDEVSGAFEDWLETLSPQEIEDLNALIDGVDECGVQIIEDDEVVDAPKEQEEAVVESKPKAEKVKCKCCGFAKKARRVNAEGICKTCYVALATSGGESIMVVGRQGKRGRNTVSVVIGGERVKVQRKVRLES
jgi:DNA segregation ATPase FtsK/SpoIIIE-like protein